MMRYFNICQDKRIPYGVLLLGLNSIGGYYEYKKGNISALEDSFVSSVNSSPVNFYPDILDRQIFMVKGAVKETIDIFIPDIRYKHCCLIDEQNSNYEQYYIPMFDIAEMHTGIQSRLYMFCREDSGDIEVLASLEFVEALFRRTPTGCRVIPIEHPWTLCSNDNVVGLAHIKLGSYPVSN